MNFEAVDFDCLEDIPPRQNYHEIPRVSISREGRVALNQALSRRLDGTRAVRARTSPDGEYLVFQMEGEPNLHFTQKGHCVTHRMLAQKLEEKGIDLPAIYTMEWWEARQAWVGRCQEITKPPAVDSLMEAVQRKRHISGRRK